jgi:tRNA(adenine34) deaminase
VGADEQLMQLALEEARAAGAEGDVPVGAVVVRGDEVVGRAGNARERSQDPTAHAEILALREASRFVGSWHLEGCTMYVTLEPCAMCAGALVLARLDRLVIGASDPKAGFVGSLGDIVRDGRLNHEVEVTVGVLSEECGEVLRAFFAERR